MKIAHEPMTVVSNVCYCGEVQKVSLPLNSLKEWRSGVSIQLAWPEGSPEQREILLSGTCPSCWNELFERGF